MCNISFSDWKKKNTDLVWCLTIEMLQIFTFFILRFQPLTCGICFVSDAQQKWWMFSKAYNSAVFHILINTNILALEIFTLYFYRFIQFLILLHCFECIEIMLLKIYHSGCPLKSCPPSLNFMAETTVTIKLLYAMKEKD